MKKRVLTKDQQMGWSLDRFFKIIYPLKFVLNNKYKRGCEPADHKLHRHSSCWIPKASWWNESGLWGTTILRNVQNCHLLWGLWPVLGLQRTQSPFPSHLLVMGWCSSEWPTEVMKGVSKNTPGVCEAVLFSQWTDAGFCSEILRAWRSLAVEVLCYRWSMRGPCLALQGEQEAQRGQGRETWAEGRGKVANVKATLHFLFLFVF